MRGWILGALAALAFADAAKAADLPARQSNRNPNSTHVTPPGRRAPLMHGWFVRGGGLMVKLGVGEPSQVRSVNGLKAISQR